MSKRGKIDLAKVIAAIVTRCVACGYEIPPAEVRRVAGSGVCCPKCGVTFKPGQGR